MTEATWKFVLRVTLRFVLRFAPPAFCTAFCGAFCTAHPNRGMPHIPFCEADCGDREMLTTYSPYPCQRPGAQRRLPTPIQYASPSVSIRAGGGPAASPSKRPIVATLACRSGGFRLLVPDLAAPVGCGSAGRFRSRSRQARHNDRDGCETTKEAI